MSIGRSLEFWKRRLVTAILLFNPTPIRSMMIHSGKTFCSKTATRLLNRRAPFQRFTSTTAFILAERSVWTRCCYSEFLLEAHRNSVRTNSPRSSPTTNKRKTTRGRRRSFTSSSLMTENEILSIRSNSSKKNTSGATINSMPKRKGKSKFYAVASGRAPGVYSTWAECQTQVNGFSNAKFKSFPTMEEAQAFVTANKSKSEDPTNIKWTGTNDSSLSSSTSAETRRVRPRVSQAEEEPAPIQNFIDPSTTAVPLGRATSGKSKDALTTGSETENITNGYGPPHKLVFHIMFDGGSRGNPHGHAGAGTYLVMSHHSADPKDGSKSCIFHEKISTRSYLGFGQLTNNQAEYQGLVTGLERIQAAVHNARRSLREVTILVQGDSDLIIKQMNGIYACKSPKLKAYHQKAKATLQSLHRDLGKSAKLCVTFEHVYREDNKIADGLANEAMDAKRTWSTTSTVTQKKRKVAQKKTSKNSETTDDDSGVEV